MAPPAPPATTPLNWVAMTVVSPVNLLAPFYFTRSPRNTATISVYTEPDGLAISNKSPREVEIIRKDLCAIFRKHGLKITIEANKKCVDFLDVNGKYVTVHGKTYVNDLGKCSLKSFVDRSLVVWNFYPFAKTF